jgi:archaellum biogenesis protein FlaJ (TadC family)
LTYAIFISFATIVAAPFLFGLATTLLTVIQKIMGQVAQTSSAGTGSFINISGGTLKISDFKIFAVTMLSITSFMSSLIISNIRKGNIKDGLKYIPIFMITTIVLYFIAEKLISTLMSTLV